MPFFRASGGAGGGIAEVLEGFNNELESLGTDEFWFFGYNSPYGSIKPLSSTRIDVSSFEYVVVIDTSKITYPNLSYSLNSGATSSTKKPVMITINKNGRVSFSMPSSSGTMTVPQDALLIIAGDNSSSTTIYVNGAN